MKRNLKITIFSLTLAAGLATAHAQFHTIVPQKPVNKEVGEIKKRQKDSIIKTKSLPLFPEEKGVKITIGKEVPLFVNVRDSLVFGLLSKRLSVCLPLDFIHLTSRYGNRYHPIDRCERFHDGIDLRCNRARVYAMMPGIIKEVGHSNKGYGNYVVLKHGNLECLYGHLSLTTVKEGDFVYAGTIVGLSGNTGKSTAPHLHIRLKRHGKSVDPLAFMDCLNGYIADIQSSLSLTRDKADKLPPLNINTLAEALDRHGVHHSKIVLAQAILETGYFRSRQCLENNNLFGLRRPSDGTYYKFKHWEESVKAYRDYVQYKYKSGDYYAFLKRIGYAADASYARKVMQIARSL